MSAGRGFIALAALIFGKWRPIPAFLTCLFFGFTDALQIQMQSNPIFESKIPVQALQIFPYVITLLVLVGFIGSARPPLAIGKSD
ncbi:MAG: ABC transporter permease, partial [Deltaproteobacteria bacterium]